MLRGRGALRGVDNKKTADNLSAVFLHSLLRLLGLATSDDEIV